MRKLDEPNDGKGRVETGTVQFGDDWPGVFIRGDNAAYHAMNVRAAIEKLEQNPDIAFAFVLIDLKGLYSTLTGCVVGPAAAMFNPPGDNENG